MNQIDLSNTNNIFTPPYTPVNLEEGQPEQDLIKPLKTSLFHFCKDFETAAKTATTNTTTTTSI